MSTLSGSFVEICFQPFSMVPFGWGLWLRSLGNSEACSVWIPLLLSRSAESENELIVQTQWQIEAVVGIREHGLVLHSQAPGPQALWV